MSTPRTCISCFIGPVSCGSMGSGIVHSLWLIEVDPHRGRSISLRPTQDFKGDARDCACPDSPRITFLSDMSQKQTILSADCSLGPLKQTTCDRHIGSPPARLCRRNRAKEHTRLARSCWLHTRRSSVVGHCTPWLSADRCEWQTTYLSFQALRRYICVEKC